jgi:hypothetical protein
MGVDRCGAEAGVHWRGRQGQTSLGIAPRARELRPADCWRARAGGRSCVRGHRAGWLGADWGTDGTRSRLRSSAGDSDIEACSCALEVHHDLPSVSVERRCRCRAPRRTEGVEASRAGLTQSVREQVRAIGLARSSFSSQDRARGVASRKYRAPSPLGACCSEAPCGTCSAAAGDCSAGDRVRRESPSDSSRAAAMPTSNGFKMARLSILDSTLEHGSARCC